MVTKVMFRSPSTESLNRLSPISVEEEWVETPRSEAYYSSPDRTKWAGYFSASPIQKRPQSAPASMRDFRPINHFPSKSPSPIKSPVKRLSTVVEPFHAVLDPIHSVIQRVLRDYPRLTQQWKSVKQENSYPRESAYLHALLQKTEQKRGEIQ